MCFCVAVHADGSAQPSPVPTPGVSEAPRSLWSRVTAHRFALEPVGYDITPLGVTPRTSFVRVASEHSHSGRLAAAAPRGAQTNPPALQRRLLNADRHRVLSVHTGRKQGIEITPPADSDRDSEEAVLASLLTDRMSSDSMASHSRAEPSGRRQQRLGGVTRPLRVLTRLQALEEPESSATQCSSDAGTPDSDSLYAFVSASGSQARGRLYVTRTEAISNALCRV